MVSYRYSLIAREGWLVLLLLLVPALVSLYQGWVLATFLTCSFFLLTLWYFRDFPRPVPASPLGIVFPVDGRIAEIANDWDPYLSRDCLRISIAMSIFGQLSTRAPMEGKVMRHWFDMPEDSEVKFILSPKAFSQWIQSDEEDNVVVVMEPPWWLPHTWSYAHTGQRVGQGQRYGFIYLASRIHILLPADVSLACETGVNVRAGSDIAATINH